MAALRSELQGLGHEHQPHLRGIVCDVTQPQQVAALAAQARELLGTVDVWICNAGEAAVLLLVVGWEAAVLLLVVGCGGLCSVFVR
jgi:NAD(P)-dependent dehydrogenase (short-subunit alcohol dehydrogenase family)